MVPIILPITDPVVVFCIVIVVLLVLPIIMGRIKIPGLVGIILAGVALGPNGFAILEKQSGIMLFGTVGILYLMFFSGLEVDFNDFKRSRFKSIVFGALTFLIPQAAGTVLNFYVLHMELPAAILLASTYASHTLLTYPLAGKLGIQKNEAVVVVIGGTIITNTASLMVMAVTTAPGSIGALYILQLALVLLVFGGAVMFLVPKLASAFFKRVESEGVQQFLFVLAVVFVCATVAKLIGVEAIIGAFIAGLALNRSISEGSSLMNRIDFTGNAIFVPFFLLYVGMLVDLRSFAASGGEALAYAGVMTGTAIATKWLAAKISGKAFKMSSAQSTLMFGLSNAQAANTLAAVMVGYNIGMLNDATLNGTIVMILITCIIAAFATEFSGKKVVLENADSLPHVPELPERIIVPISRPDSIQGLVDLAHLIKNPASQEAIYPVNIITKTDDVQERIARSRSMLTDAVKHAAGSENFAQLVTRVDVNVAGGLSRALHEVGGSVLVMGKAPEVKFSIFSTAVLQQILDETDAMVFVLHKQHSFEIIKKVHVMIPPYAELEEGFTVAIRAITNLIRRVKADVVWYLSPSTDAVLDRLYQELVIHLKTDKYLYRNVDELRTLAPASLTEKESLVLVSARNNTISYNDEVRHFYVRLMRRAREINHLVVYPKGQAQSASGIGRHISALSGKDILTTLKDRIRSLFKR